MAGYMMKMLESANTSGDGSEGGSGFTRSVGVRLTQPAGLVVPESGSGSGD